MSDTNLKPRPYGHVSSGSMDTNASAIAESTISLGLSRFPEPPSSIPSTPLRSEFGGTPSPSRTTFSIPPIPLNSPLRPIQDAGRFHPSSPHTAGRNRSLKTNSTPFHAPHTKDNLLRSSQLPSAYDSDGTSTIDADATEDSLLPTSFITSLLQENKAQRRLKHTTTTSDAMSGISEMTYPPFIDRSDTDDTLYTSRRPLDSHIPPGAYSQAHKPSRHISGDSETLHSNQDHTPMIRTASVVRAQGASVVGIAPATFRNKSGAKRCSSSLDIERPQSINKSLHRRLSTTYETGDDPPDGYKSLNSSYGPSFPSTTGTQGPILRSGPAEPRIKDTITNSARSSLLSRISRISLRRAFVWRKVKPLPPVPRLPHIPLSTENAHRRYEESASLPELANRAEALRDLLGKGQNPHYSMVSSDVFFEPPRSVHGPGGGEFKNVPMAAASHLSPLRRVLSPAKHQPAATNAFVPGKKKRKYFLIFFVLIIVIAAIGAGVGVSVGSRKKQRLPSCTGTFTGATCNLDATCVCTSSATCNGLAKAVVDLLPLVNQNFATNISLTLAYSSLWIMQGSPTTGNCASQALLVDVGNSDNQHLHPNRTQWAQTALLWNALQTQDTNAAEQLQQFVEKIPWTSLGTTDGPISTANSEREFSTTVAGFTFNFASQTVTQPSASFVVLGQPTNAQISRVSSQAQTTLDRMYAFAQASSTQRQTALKTYWTSVLHQRPQDLAVFKSALSVSPILLPFNASSPSIQTLYSNSTSSSFPPPLACFPNLTSGVQQKLSSVETGVFGLQPIANTTSQFDTSCYQDRPVYGVLDVLRLRLPFLDSQTGTVKQAVVLTRDANPRVVLYNGLIFSTPLNGTTTLTLSQLDARQYGTLNLFDHVILQYLTSIPDVNMANALISFVLGGINTSLPPDKSSPLFQSLQSIPFLEVAVFGDVGPPDLTSTIASFTTSSNSLFFGSADGTALRNWTIDTVNGQVVWTENATSPLVVRDNSLGDTAISQTWTAVSIAISNHDSSIGLSNITTTLQGTRNFSP
ncbi:hypothetical protein BYT27DRAFT_7097571 [Phlegmacium glaucopus]|nr:hypothetical protein BYT27DRAFT_7097571 [Phlegmacium glaucopus]